jgi:hypothetical protein
MGTTEEFEQKYSLLFPHLNERQQHLVAAVDAQQLGRGGVSRISRGLPPKNWSSRNGSLRVE